MRLYLDASTIIYSIEGATPFRKAAVRWIQDAEAAEDGTLITSRLSRLECRVKPLRERDAELLAHYEVFFGRRDLLFVDVSGEIIEHATDIRARYNVRSADAIHLATALHKVADAFVTGDRQLARCKELNVEVIADPQAH